MIFPKNIEQFQLAKLKAAEMAAQTHRNANLLKKQADAYDEIMIVLNGILTSWQEVDPGKSRGVYFFLSAVRPNDRVVVRELIQKSSICNTPKEWDNYRKNREKGYWQPYEKVPYHYSVVYFDDVRKARCLNCKTQQPVIEHYVQTFDGPDGDEWLKEHFVLCLRCSVKTILSSETSCERF